ncbi:hypothetical protein FHR75_003144 [Kineococcus radiotolerans]|uniref:Uncharacterized protein n=1 Tax=Kineococcus radiotolerans TaxID=131568 RepID=A0A7W4XXV0_KINRA|nr:hypothetical protein [Kineococcus radiotolerans]MBB2902313.1 hypothetical protein [Kineococcus radiotolerans]
MLIWVLVGVLAAGGVLVASWWDNRRTWRAEQARSREWLRGLGVDPGPVPADPPAWRLVLTPDLSGTGRFVHDVAAAPARAGARG